MQLPSALRFSIIMAMDWEEIIPIITALLFTVGLPIALLARRKRGPKPAQDFLLHLQGIGVKARALEEGDEPDAIQPKRSWGEKLDTLAKIEGSNIDYVAITSTSSQYGTNLYINYLVRETGAPGRPDRKKTKMVRRKSPPIWGKVVDIEWKGDPHLSQRLNFDYSLKYKLLNEGLPTLKGDIQIIPEHKAGHTKIKTNFELPSPELFQCLDIIAKHVKSWT